jgi:branched-chain amino acid transport system permease protein
MIWGKLPTDYRVPSWLDFPPSRSTRPTIPPTRLFMLLFSIVIFIGLILMLTSHPRRPHHPGFAHASEHGRHARPQRAARLHAGVRPRHRARRGRRRDRGAAYVTQSNMAALLGPILFVVVVVGGLGSLWGAFVASLLIGLLQTFAIASDWSLNKFFGDFITPTRGTLLFDVWNVTIAQVGPILPYLLLVLVLIFRPTGLFGTRET